MDVEPMTKPGEATCKCGIPGCQGHEIDKNGEVHIPNHPRGYLIFHGLGGEHDNR
jgi:hypothetical protein